MSSTSTFSDSMPSATGGTKSQTVEKKYGWYSDSQRKKTGLSVYKNIYGKEVYVTTVSDTPDHATLWKDIVFVGMVTEWIRTERYGYGFTKLEESFDCDLERSREKFRLDKEKIRQNKKKFQLDKKNSNWIKKNSVLTKKNPTQHKKKSIEQISMI